MTKNGKVILDIINSSSYHPTAEEVYRTTYESGNTMSLATVYNNLNRLCEEGHIRRLTGPEQPDRFDRLLRHDHLICKRCGKISDLYLRDRKSELEEEAGVSCESYDLTIFYICESCRAE